MSHYTVLVAIDPTDPKRPDLETALAPFNENLEVEPYRVYEEGEPTGYWLYTYLKRQAQHVVDGTGILPYDPDFHGASNARSSKTEHQQRAEMQADADAFHALHGASPVSWADIVKLRNERYGDESPSEVLHLSEDGRAYTVSTYSSDVYRADVCPGWGIDGEGRQAGESTRLEILHALQGDEAVGGVSGRKAQSRRSLHVLLPMHEGAECGPYSRSEVALDAGGEIRHHAGAVRDVVPGAGGAVCDLPGDPEGVEEPRGGSRPLDGAGEGSAVCALQLGLGPLGGPARRAPCGSAVPHGPYETHRGLIAGAKWDWYQVGGRWTGYFYSRPEYTGHPGLINGEPGTMTEPNFNRAKCDGGPKYMLDFDATRKMAEAEELGRHVEFCKLVEGLPEATLWSAFVERHKADEDGYTIEQARADYHAQPRVLALKGTDFQYWNDPLERFQRPREEVLARAAAQAVPGFATLTLDGQWKEPGRMGWFGMSTDTPESQDAYYAWANEYVDGLDEDIVLVLVDVHI